MMIFNTDDDTALGEGVWDSVAVRSWRSGASYRESKRDLQVPELKGKTGPLKPKESVCLDCARPN